MMFAQVFYLLILYFAPWTGGDQGIVVPQPARVLSRRDLARPHQPDRALHERACAVLARAADHAGARPLPLWPRAGRHPRERGAHQDAGLRHLLQQAHRRRRLRHVCAASGAAYALLFGYVGSSFASVQYSILPLLWVLLGGAATTLGPLIGTRVHVLCHRHHQRLHLGLSADRRHRAHPAGAVFPKGILGSIRQRWLGWLP